MKTFKQIGRCTEARVYLTKKTVTMATLQQEEEMELFYKNNIPTHMPQLEANKAGMCLRFDILGNHDLKPLGYKESK
jgi:hypothetical protein